MNSKDCVINMANYYFKVFKAQGLNIYDYETPIEYSRRIEEQLSYEKYKYDKETFYNFKNRINKSYVLGQQSGFKSVIDIFLIARYSTKQISEYEKNIVIEYYQRVIAEAKGNLGLMKYFTYRYLVGKF